MSHEITGGITIGPCGGGSSGGAGTGTQKTKQSRAGVTPEVWATLTPAEKKQVLAEVELQKADDKWRTMQGKPLRNLKELGITEIQTGTNTVTITPDGVAASPANVLISADAEEEIEKETEEAEENAEENTEKEKETYTINLSAPDKSYEQAKRSNTQLKNLTIDVNRQKEVVRKLSAYKSATESNMPGHGRYLTQLKILKDKEKKLAPVKQVIDNVMKNLPRQIQNSIDAMKRKDSSYNKTVEDIITRYPRPIFTV